MDTKEKPTAAIVWVNNIKIVPPPFIIEVQRVLKNNAGKGFCDVCLMRYAPTPRVTPISDLLDLLLRYFPAPQHGRCADCGETTLVVSG